MSKKAEKLKQMEQALAASRAAQSIKPVAGTIGKTQYISFKGSRNFRERIVCSLLSTKPIRIDDIRTTSDQPGLKDYEISFLRLVDKITNGTELQINHTGGGLKFKPGIITGGSVLDIIHDCPTTRSIGYFIEPLLRLGPFAKNPLTVVFQGVTNDDHDLSVDLIRTVSIPLLKKFGMEEDIEIKVRKRGAAPGGGGEVLFKCPITKRMNPIQLLDEGKIKRVRGLAYTTRCSPQIANRLVESAKSILNKFIPDVFIYTDAFKGKNSGNSPGFALSLLAESTTGCLLSAELCGSQSSLPEEMGKHVAGLLCQEISGGGVVDSAHQSLMLLMMALCPEDVSKIRLGKLTPYTIECLRLYREFFGVTFKIVAEPETKTVLLSCKGIGYQNLSRKTLA